MNDLQRPTKRQRTLSSGSGQPEIPSGWAREVGDERRFNLSRRVDAVERELVRKNAIIADLRRQVSRQQRSMETLQTKVDQMYALTLLEHEELTPVIDVDDDFETFTPPIDPRISRLFSGLEIPLRELELYESDADFQVECRAEMTRVARQEEETNKQQKKVKFSSQFEKAIEAADFSVPDSVSSDRGAFATLTGTRHDNEDRFLNYYFRAGNTPLMVKAVFDGHGGDEAAQFCRDKFSEIFPACWTEFVKEGRPFEIGNALKTMCVWLDAAHQAHSRSYIGRPTPGTTACMTMIVGDLLFIASVGDSSAVLCTPNSEEAKQLSFEYKGSDAYAQQTVTDRGGAIIAGRVAYRGRGSLAVTRAIGDEYLRGADGKKPISPTPGITVINLASLKDRAKCTLLVMSDGISDVATPVALARQTNRLRAQGAKEVEVAKTLVTGAKLAGSIDDVTVGVIYL